MTGVVEGAHAQASNGLRMGTDIAELAGVVFLVAFYIWLIIVLVTPLCRWIVRLFAGLNSSLSDEAVRDRVTDTALGKVFLAAFWPFGEVKTRESTITDRDASITSARLLMDENRRLCEWKLASIRTIEQKAISQVTAAGIILAVVAAFGRDDLPFGYKAIPIALLIVAIMAYIRTAYMRVDGMPSFGDLNSDVLADPLDEGRLAIHAAGAWYEFGLELDAVNKSKARYATTGNFWLIAALFMILLLVSLAAPSGTANRGACCTPTPNPLMTGTPRF